ncbi:hypothetical protein Ancab_017844, partial [Ancistrocladus abbreviatus]
LLDYYTGKGREAMDPQKGRDATLFDYYTGNADYTISNATPSTNNSIPDPTSLPDYYTDLQKQHDIVLFDYYAGNASYTIPNATPSTNNPIPDPTSLPEGMQLDEEHSARLKLDSKLSESMKPECRFVA